MVILIAIVWACSLYGENILTHAYYRGLTLPHGTREKLTEQEIADIAVLTEERFTNSWLSCLPPALIIAIAANALRIERKKNGKGTLNPNHLMTQ